MNIRKMIKYTMDKSENAAVWFPVSGTPYTEERWREFEAMGFVELFNMGDTETAVAPEKKCIAWRILRRRDWLNRSIGFFAGIATSVLSGVILRLIFAG